MSGENSVFAIDAGNTSIKVGLLINEELQEVKRFNSDAFQDVKEWLKQTPSAQIVVSSVLSEKQTAKMLGGLKGVLMVDRSSKLPIENSYKSQETLGIDRLCNAVYAHKMKKTKSAVCIDIGTCIKFDLICGEQYIGGSISPGLDLRFAALNDYTGKLPLLSNKNAVDLVGTDTEASIRSGVTNGISAEIHKMIELYQQGYEDLTFFVTGGDAAFFEIRSKINIFADENLTIKGLFEIYKHNA